MHLSHSLAMGKINRAALLSMEQIDKFFTSSLNLRNTQPRVTASSSPFDSHWDEQQCFLSVKNHPHSLKRRIQTNSTTAKQAIPITVFPVLSKNSTMGRVPLLEHFLCRRYFLRVCPRTSKQLSLVEKRNTSAEQTTVSNALPLKHNSYILYLKQNQPTNNKKNKK